MYPSLEAYTRSIAVVLLSPDVVLIHPASMYPSPCVRTILLASLFRPVCTSNPSSKSAFKLETLVVDATVKGAVPVATVETSAGAETLTFDVQRPVELTQLKVLSVAPLSVIPPPSAVKSVAPLNVNIAPFARPLPVNV